ncbi:MAG: DNA-damage-inducible protein J [Candidatus Kentron sp. G]|nr:MAG: DNA-damage-inducible protein J [Candidatus Kentron sp. G]VFN01872.1 MAG: DNA-damage-inducible protein J [Candidatus Kentron sp. G]VFN05430.1 MAG: DNA-damage-inducible protein J [Candidatus Kentron sp. G]
MSAVVRARISEEVKNEAAVVPEAMDLTVSGAFRM